MYHNCTCSLSSFKSARSSFYNSCLWEQPIKLLSLLLMEKIYFRRSTKFEVIIIISFIEYIVQHLFLNMYIWTWVKFLIDYLFQAIHLQTWILTTGLRYSRASVQVQEIQARLKYKSNYICDALKGFIPNFGAALTNLTSWLCWTEE